MSLQIVDGTRVAMPYCTSSSVAEMAAKKLKDRYDSIVSAKVLWGYNQIEIGLRVEVTLSFKQAMQEFVWNYCASH